MFLLFTMLSSVAVTLMQQVQASSVCEFKESKTDDDNNTSDSDEKESKTEKDLFAYKNTLRTHAEFWTSADLKAKVYAHDEELISALYTSLPYNPPEV
jgi:hypothetical protein